MSKDDAMVIATPCCLIVGFVKMGYSLVSVGVGVIGLGYFLLWKLIKGGTSGV